MAFLFPSEFRAPVDQEVYSDFDESEYEEIVAKLTVIQQAIFDKPVKHQHLKALYVKGFVDGKPMSKMLIETDMMLKDFGGNASKTRGNECRIDNRK